MDPVELVVRHVKNVKETGVTRTRCGTVASCRSYPQSHHLCGSRFLHRLVPVSDTCVANAAEIQSLCRKVFEPFFSKHRDRKFTVSDEAGLYSLGSWLSDMSVQN